MKRILSILTSLLLTATLCVGCGAPKTDQNTGTPEAKPATEEKKDENKTDDNKGDDAKKASVKLPVTAGFIYIGHINDGGFTQAHDKGRQELEKNLGPDKVKTIYQEAVPENIQDVKNSVKIMIDQGASIIFANSFGYMDAIAELANEYPDVKFMHFSGYKKNDTNFGNYFGAMEEPRYLSGIVAGYKTKSDKIGFVGAFPLPELFIAINAFTLGVQSVNPKATVKVVWTNSWYDPAKEKEAAEALLASGCDVIAQHCDTTGPQVAAESKGKFAIGYNSNSYEAAPKAFMTAPVWNHGVFYTKQVEDVINGTWKPESYYGTIKDGYVDLLPLTENAPKESVDKVKEIKDKMAKGEFKVFTGPIKNQKGEVVVPEGKSLNREEIWKTDYFVQGVEGTTK